MHVLGWWREDSLTSLLRLIVGLSRAAHVPLIVVLEGFVHLARILLLAASDGKLGAAPTAISRLLRSQTLADASLRRQSRLRIMNFLDTAALRVITMGATLRH